MSDRDDIFEAAPSSQEAGSSAPATGAGEDASYLRVVASSTSSPGSTRAGRASRQRGTDVFYLRPVPDMTEPARSEPARSEPAGGQESGQLSLFPHLSDVTPSLMAFLDMSTASDKAFTALIRETTPRWLLDLRPAPRFDYGRLHRRLAFRLFSDHGVTYHDVAGSLSMRDRHDARLHAGILSRELNDLLARSAQQLTGPVVVLVDDPAVLLTARDILPKTLEPRPKRGWQSRVVTMRGERYFLVH